MLKFGNLVISRVIKQSVRAGPGFAFLILLGWGSQGAGAAAAGGGGLVGCFQTSSGN